GGRGAVIQVWPGLLPNISADRTPWNRTSSESGRTGSGVSWGCGWSYLAADGDGATRLAVLLEVALVGFLGPVERGRRSDFRDDLPPSRCLLEVARLDRERLLSRSVVEDRRPVLAAEVQALAVPAGRIMATPERLEELGVTDLRRVEPYL